jgi:hypothetical protein
MAKATLLLSYKAQQGDLIVQLVVWQLPVDAAGGPGGFTSGVPGRPSFAMTTRPAKGRIDTWVPTKWKKPTNSRRSSN